MSPVCVRCSKPIMKNGESEANYRARIYCGRACYLASIKRVVAPKPCQVCRCIMHRRPNEATTEFIKRVTCSHRCGHALMWAKRKNKPVVVPRQIVFHTEQPEEWLKHHEITKCPPRYAAPIEHYMHVSVRNGRAP